MSKNLFSGLEDLGFEDVNEINLFDKKEEQKSETTSEKEEADLSSLLYDKEVVCPVCENKFKARSVKTSSYRTVKKESDFFIRYALINPYFYDVYLCNVCGYAAMKVDFEKIRTIQIELIQQRVTPKWRGRRYPEVYDLPIAIERYKLALLNYTLTEAKPSKKAMCCLKLAWMHRLSEDSTNEELFLGQALEGFSNAYQNEDFPLYGMDKFTTMYLLGELNRRLGKYEEAMSWFSKVITASNVNQKIKELARDQKDLIKEVEQEHTTIPNQENEATSKKNGFFSRFFK